MGRNSKSNSLLRRKQMKSIVDDYNNKHYGKVKEPDELLYMRDRYDFLQCNYVQ